MTSPPLAVIFDADGVIFDSEKFSLQAFCETAAEFGPPLDDDQIAENCGQTDAAIVDQLSRQFGTHIEYEAFRKRKFARYCELVEQATLEVFPGVMELLETLREREIPHAVASSGSPTKIEFNMTKTGLAEEFSVIVSGEELGTSKPDPAVFLHTAEILEMPPNRCLVIEDSINGVAAAKAAGMPVAAVTNTFHRHQLRQADLIVDSLEELTFVKIHDLVLRPHVQEALARD